jgi:hypothetical protein
MTASPPHRTRHRQLTLPRFPGQVGSWWFGARRAWTIVDAIATKYTGAPLPPEARNASSPSPDLSVSVSARPWRSDERKRHQRSAVVRSCRCRRRSSARDGDLRGLGFEHGDPMHLEGEWMDRVVGLDGVQAEMVTVNAPDGSGRLERTKYLPTSRSSTCTSTVGEPVGGSPHRLRRGGPRQCRQPTSRQGTEHHRRHRQLREHLSSLLHRRPRRPHRGTRGAGPDRL